MKKTERVKRTRLAVKPAAKVSNDGTNTPVPDTAAPAPLLKGEAELYQQARNPLGDPHKI
ncbi:hypothetical protein [Mucilaginibacter aquaedulcis]|uniref:hypothetical protein n=1 Tax=Mucilaginibacter aquaedulcis TaxID=1187081 RepID=UPI0025B4D0AA|nr:hypothetical protein [Mucilaginibacter aquaedulcis]MDN3547839.1 hypothetical protein [Mucilaginibacter aquaedulcis]